MKNLQEAGAAAGKDYVSRPGFPKPGEFPTQIMLKQKAGGRVMFDQVVHSESTLRHRWSRSAVAALISFAVVCSAGPVLAADTDGDGMADNYELFFGLNPSSSADAPIDSDADTWLNLTESGYWTDPFCKDTDRDGWSDPADANPFSRAVMLWGASKFTSTTNYNYVGPSWWIGGEMTGGTWLTNAWSVSQQVQTPVALRIPIVNTLITNNLTMSLTFMDQYGGLYVDLIRTNGVVDTNMFGNLMVGTYTVVTRTYQLPATNIARTAKIQLRRDYGMATIYDTTLYFDRDQDGLDDQQEFQAGTDPLYTNGIQGTVPGILQVEDFGPGGEGRGYHDTTTGNAGGQYRITENVDIEACADSGGGYDVTGTRAGEWMAYTVLVTNEGSYNVSVRAASPTNGGSFHVAVDGTTVYGIVPVPKTGGTQSWYSVQLGSAYLGKGLHVIRLTMDAEPTIGNVGNFNYIKVTPAGVNQPPEPDAGPDQTITLPASALLTAGYSDDGLPSGAVYTVTWNKQSGPGTVNFSNVSPTSARAYFGLSGVYAINCLVSDSQLTGTDVVQVTVNPAPMNTPPSVNAGTNLTITMPALASLNGAVTDDMLPSNYLVYAWSKSTGPGNVTFGNSNLLATTAGFSTGGTYVLQLAASDGQLSSFSTVWITVNNAPAANTAPTVNAGTNRTVILPSPVSLAGTATDDGLPSNRITVAWSTASGPGSVAFSSATSSNTTATFTNAGSFVLRFVASDGALSSTSTVMIAVSNAPANTAPVVNAGTNQFVILPAAANIAGTATDDGLPSNNLTVAWSRVSGAGTATFASASSSNTTVSFSTGGVHVLQFVASDGALSATSTVTITANARPVVSAGSAQTVFMPNSAVLSGSVSDDTYPSNKVTIQWSQVGGVGVVAFTNAATANTRATFSTAGTYVLQLTAHDGTLGATSSVTIAVSNAVVSSNALVAKWSFEQSAWTGGVGEVVDSSSASNHGRAVSGAMTVLTGTVGRAACFAATNSCIEVPSSTSLQVNADMTLSFWIRSANVGSLRLNPLDKSYGGEFALTIEPNGSLSFYHGSAQVSGSYWSLVALPANSLVNGLWQHVAIVRSTGSTNVSCYLNGKLVTSATYSMTASMLPTKTTNVIRMAKGYTGSGVNGCMDEVCIYGRSLSAAEVYSSYLTTRPVNQAPYVYAGPNATITLPAGASLSGVAVDDGLPSGVLTTQWSQVSGTGTVAFAAATSPTTTATFPTGGVYVLKLIAGDGAYVSTGTVQITVNNPPLPTAPSITAFTVSSSSNFHSEGSVTLQTTATDVNGDAISYQFAVQGSIVSAWSTNRTVVWTPGLTNSGAKVFTAYVKDPGGLTSQLSKTNYIYMTPPRP